MDDTKPAAVVPAVIEEVGTSFVYYMVDYCNSLQSALELESELGLRLRRYTASQSYSWPLFQAYNFTSVHPRAKGNLQAVEEFQGQYMSEKARDSFRILTVKDMNPVLMLAGTQDLTDWFKKYVANYTIGKVPICLSIYMVDY